MLVLVGPSASGKTWVAQSLIKDYNMKKMVTYTTRPMRPGEVDGKDYHFISKEEFQKKVDEKFFLEHVTYNDNFYGTSFAEISDDKVVILEPTGLKQYLKLIPEKLTVIYLRCSREIVRIRMMQRGETLEGALKRLDLDEKVFTKDIENLADYVIDTSSSNVVAVTKKVYALYEKRIRKN